MVMAYTTVLDRMNNIRNGVAETISSNSVVGLRLVMTLAPIVVLVIAVIIFRRRYILTDAKLAEILKELRSREA